MLDAVSHEKYNYAVEFRHRSWLDESRKEMDPAALEVLRERNAANVLIDGPGLHVGTDQTADHAYMRFHGREAKEMQGDFRNVKPISDINRNFPFILSVLWRILL